TAPPPARPRPPARRPRAPWSCHRTARGSGRSPACAGRSRACRRASGSRSLAAYPPLTPPDPAGTRAGRDSLTDGRPEREVVMRVAVAGATGNIGSWTVAALERDGHETVRISRSLGVDLLTGEGLDEALTGAEAVIDVTNAPPSDRAAAVSYFGTATANLLAAEQRAGVRHHVLLSIVGIHRVEDNPHYAGKREQERLVSGGPVPWTIVPSTQFHDF